MTNTATINGHTYTDDGNANTGMANGGHRYRLIPLVADVVVVAADVVVKSGVATTQAGIATAQAEISSTQAGIATTKAGEAGASANLAHQYALDAASAAQQDLSAIDRTVHTGTSIVDTLIYDTSKDSDGGAWRERCQHTSWYQETIYGVWLGERANETAARTVSGATTNDYYHNTADGKFYALNAGSGQTEVFRGNAREFPARALIVMRVNQIVVYDLTHAGAPMWMVLCGMGLSALFNKHGGGNAVEKAVSALNGQVLCAYSAGAPTNGGGLFIANFIADTARLRSSEYGAMRGYLPQTLSSRLVATVSVEDTTSPGILSAYCNNVAITTLPDAPIDSATGLPVPTIYVGTNGGLSRIANDGTVSSVVLQSTSGYKFAFDGDYVICADGFDASSGIYSSLCAIQKTATLSGGAGNQVLAQQAAWIKLAGGSFYGVIPRVSGITSSGLALNAVSINEGIARLKPNYSAPTSGMVTAITNAYNSGWMVGDIRGAWLADTVAGAVGATDPDRSVKNNPLTLYGSLTKAAVASGAQLMGYSGFGASNYLQQAYSANLDFGTGDFCICGWFKTDGAYGRGLLSRNDSAGTGPALSLNFATGPQLWMGAGSGSFVCEATGLADNNWHQYFVTRSGSTCSIYIDGRFITSAASAASVTNTSAVLTIGAYYGGAAPFIGSQALIRVSATAPSADQIKYIFETEKALFQASAKCCIDGTSTAATALAYDEDTDLLHMGTSWGRSAFQGLVRVASEATPVGALVALSASNGALAQAGSTAADVYVPAYLLREELARGQEQESAFGSALVAHEFDATTGQVAFTLPVGWRPKFVYSAAALKREGSTKDYTVGFDGFRWTVTFAAAPGNGVWVSVLAVREAL